MRHYSVRKCVLEREGMVKVIVKFCNTIIKFNHYPERWLKSVDVMIEKGKGPRITKLRTLEMAEEDMKFIMRTFLA